MDIIDPDNGKVLFELEHEVRCVTHPMYRRPLINRNPAQRQPTYVRVSTLAAFDREWGERAAPHSPPSADRIR